MGNLADKFSRLVALKPVRATPARPPELRLPNETDPISLLLGGGIARNQYGEHWRSAIGSPRRILAAFGDCVGTVDQSIEFELSRSKNRARTAHTADAWTPGRSGKVAFSRYGNDRAGRRNGHICVSRWTGLVGRGRTAGRTAFSARPARRIFLASGACPAHCGAAGAGDVQWEDIRLAIVGKPFHDDAAIRVPQLAAHLDLLHPARVLWRLRLGSVRLVELERHVLDAERLGWRREDDVASALIPEYYFEYLRGGSGTTAGLRRAAQPDGPARAGGTFGKINSLLDRAKTDLARRILWTFLDCRSSCIARAKRNWLIPHAFRR